MRSIKYIAGLVLVSVLSVSCFSSKKILYFQGVDEAAVDTTKVNYSPVLKPDDQLSILVSSMDMEAAMPFNLPAASFNTSGLSTNGNPQLQTYLIAQNGTIEFPQLGNIHVAGLTRLEVIALFKEKLTPLLRDPVITVQIVNFKVTVLGEVKKPGTYPVKNERITVVEAIGLAGDMSLWGVRSNVLVIRETELGKTYNRIDLTTADMFNSPVYYLQQNDVVYIEPNSPRVNNAATSATTGIIISVTGLIITIISILTR